MLPLAAFGHGCLTFLLPQPFQKTGITIRKRFYKTRELALDDVFDYIDASIIENESRHLRGVSTDAIERASF
jgi:hypothetical protein